MLLKREWCRVMTGFFGLSLVVLFSVPALAAESDVTKLIRLLQEKKIVTSQEAESLLQEMTVNTKEEKEAIKAEVKAEIAKSAQKGDFLPSALKGFKFGTTVFAGWESFDRSWHNNSGKTSSNRFYVDRAHFTVQRCERLAGHRRRYGPLYDEPQRYYRHRLGHPAEKRLCQIKLLRYHDPRGYDSYLFLGLRLGGLALPGTVQKLPGCAGDHRLWYFQSGRIRRLHGRGYLKFASKPFAGKWGGWMVGVFNGAGYTTEEGNGNKVVSGLVYFRPAPTVPILKGLQLAYMGTYGKSNRAFTATYGSTTDNPDWYVNLVEASLQHKYFTILGQYYWGQGTRQSQEELDRRGHLVAGFMRIPGLENMRVFGKYYYIDPDSSNETRTGMRASQYKTYVAGLSYDVTNEFMPFVSVERRHYNKELAWNTSDYNKYQVGFQFKF